MNTLYVVATPIGNLEDISIRAIKILLTVPVIICEDTRHTGFLIQHIKEKYSNFVNITLSDPSLNLRGGSNGGDIKKRYISVRDWNEVNQISQVLQVLQESDVAMVSDAGTPLLSDPGFKVVRAVREMGIKVIPIPGPFAAAAALSAVGLPTNKFTFLGFLNKKWEIEPNVTTIIYESPKRAEQTIEKIKTRYPTAKIVIARELTKIYEYIGPPDGKNEKGEVTILVNYDRSSPSEEESASD